jgi:hypothetical protein
MSMTTGNSTPSKLAELSPEAVNEVDVPSADGVMSNTYKPAYGAHGGGPPIPVTPRLVVWQKLFGGKK